MNSQILKQNLPMKPTRTQIFRTGFYGLRKLQSGFGVMMASAISAQDLTAESFEKLEMKRSRQSFHHN